MLKHLCLLLTLSFSLIWVPTARAAGQTYFVSPQGDDQNPGTLAEPFRTIQHAVDQTVAGDTVLVRGGTYVETVTIEQSGTAVSPITIAAYADEQPIIDGLYQLPTPPPDGYARCNETVSPPRCMHYKPLVSIEGDYIIFRGFDITQSLGRGIRIWRLNGRPHQITVENNRVYENRNAAILALYTDQVQILNNEVWQNANYAIHDRSPHDLNWPHAVNMNYSTDVTVRGNLVYENHGEGIGAGRGSVGVLIEDNILFDNKIQIYVHRAQEVIVQRNLAYCTNRKAFYRGGDPPPGIVINNEANFANDITVVNAQILNNIVTGCRINFGMWGGGGEEKIGSEQVLVAHNTLIEAVNNEWDDDEALGINITDAPHRDVLIQNNLIVQSSGWLVNVGGGAEITFVSNLWSELPDERARGEGDIIGLPQFAQTERPLAPQTVRPQWFRLLPGSPGVDTGTAVFPTPLSHDFFGNLRDSWPDLGAHELDGTAPPVVTGGNLLPNADFEANPFTEYFTVGDGTFAWNNTASHSGTHALSISGDEGLSRWLTKTRLLTVNPAAEGYTLSAWLRGTGIEPDTVRLTINYWDADLNYLFGDELQLTPTETWTRFAHQTQRPIPDEAVYVRVEFRLYGAGQLWIDDARLTER